MPLPQELELSRFLQRTFSGYRLDLPAGLKLSVRDVRTGQVLRLADTYYWAGQNFAVIVAELEYWKPTWEEELDAS